MQDLPVPVAAESELGQLLAALEAAETAVAAQRLVCTTAREAYRSAELAQRRSGYAPSKSHRPAEELDAEHARVLELLNARDIEARRLVPMLARMRDLRQRWATDYGEFVRLHDTMTELKRLGG